MSGQVASLGAYDQCINIVVPEKQSREPKEPVRGKYCMIRMHPTVPERKLWTPIHGIIPELQNMTTPDMILNDYVGFAQFFHFLSVIMGACVPSTCTNEDVVKIGHQVADLLGFVVRVTVPRCEMIESWNFTGEQIAALSAIGFLALCVLIGTAVDCLFHFVPKEKCPRRLNVDSCLGKMCLAFSVHKNTKKLFNTDQPPGNVQVIHGIRALSVLWVVYCHTYFYFNQHAASRLIRSRAFTREIGFQFINNGFIGVDTFFLMSGLLVAYWRMNNKKPFNVPLYIFRRMWRLTPAYMLCVALVILMPAIGSGPVWHETLDGYVNNCRKNWWLNLLYVNNFIKMETICMEHTWYVAADTQLYISSLIIILPIAIWPKIALTVNGLVMVAASVATYFINHYYHLPPSGLVVYPDPKDYRYFGDKIYIKPYPHIAPYCLGIAIGYFIATNRKLRISPIVQVLGWCTSIVLMVSVIFGVREWNSGNIPTNEVSSLYAATSRIAWCLGVSWISVTCTVGYGGFINHFLSWKAFIPVSRLSYLIYLVHPLVQLVYTAYSHERIYLDHTIFFWLFCGHILVSTGVAYVCCIACESPCMALEKLIIKPKKVENDSLPHLHPIKSLKDEQKVEDCKGTDPRHQNGLNGTTSQGYVCRL